MDNNGKQPGGTPINGDIMNLPGKRNPNSGLGAFLRIWNSMGLNQPGNKTVIINQDDKDILKSAIVKLLLFATLTKTD